jgi:hypothetical protein
MCPAFFLAQACLVRRSPRPIFIQWAGLSILGAWQRWLEAQPFAVEIEVPHNCVLTFPWKAEGSFAKLNFKAILRNPN